MRRRNFPTSSVTVIAIRWGVIILLLGLPFLNAVSSLSLQVVFSLLSSVAPFSTSVIRVIGTLNRLKSYLMHLQSKFTVSKGTWHHVRITWSIGTRTHWYYVNGQLWRSQTASLIEGEDIVKLGRAGTISGESERKLNETTSESWHDVTETLGEEEKIEEERRSPTTGYGTGIFSTLDTS